MIDSVKMLVIAGCLIRMLSAEGVPFGGIGAGHWTINQNSGAIEMMEFQRMGETAGIKGNAAPAGCFFAAFVKSGTSTWAKKLNTGDGVSLKYNGKYPKLFVDYSHTALPVTLRLEAFTPFIVGSDKYSSAPMAFLIFKITNTTNSTIDAGVAVSWELAGASIEKITEGSVIKGIKLNDGGNNQTVYSIDESGGSVSCGSTYSEFTDDGALNNTPSGSSGLLASKTTLNAQESKEVVFVVTWYSTADCYYKNNFASSMGAALDAALNYTTIRSDVNKWYDRIMNSNLPEWIKNHILNGGYVMSLNTAWQQSGKEWMMESSEYWVKGTFDHQFYSTIYELMFAPAAANGHLKAFADYQNADGSIAHGLNDNYDIMVDIQSKFILNAYRNYIWTGDKAKLEYVYPAIKKVIQFMLNNDADKDYVINLARCTYDNTTWGAEHSLGNSYWLAALKAAVKIAAAMNDQTNVTRWQGIFDTASANFDKQLWNANGWYNAWPGNTGCIDGQLAGQWYSEFLGLGNIVNDTTRINKAMQSIHAKNILVVINPSYKMIRVSDNKTVQNDDCWYPICYHYSFGAIRRGFADFALEDTKYSYDYFYTYYPDRTYNQRLIVGNSRPALGWGSHYMTTPMMWHEIADIQGYALNIPEKKLWIKPNLPKNEPNNMKGELHAPLLGSLSWGYLDYSEIEPGLDQHLKISYDKPVSFSRIYLKNTGNAIVAVKQGTSFIPVTVKPIVNEYELSFSQDIVIDDAGIDIYVGEGTAILESDIFDARHSISQIHVKHNTVQFTLRKPMLLTLALYTASAKKVAVYSPKRFNKGLNSVSLGRTTVSKGIYYCQFTAKSFSYTVPVICL